MLASKFLIVLASLSLSAKFAQAEVGQFKPITDGINFRASYQVHSFVQGVPISTSDIYESYHSALATGLIRQTIQNERDEAKATPTGNTFKYLYDSGARRLVEFSKDRDEGNPDGDKLFHDDFYLPENGCTNSYRSYSFSQQTARDQQSLCEEYFNSAQVLAQDTRLDSRLLLAGLDSSMPQLNLDEFMTEECLARIHSDLHYIQGVSRLLHLIECRQDEFELAQMKPSLTRNVPSRQYRAIHLKPATTSTTSERAAQGIGSLDLTFTRAELDHAGPFGQHLESQAIPLSMMLSFDPSVTILINVFQFETLAPDEHLSESANSHSIYMMPLAHVGLNMALEVIQRPHRGGNEVLHETTGKSFSFKGLLTGNIINKYYQDTIEVSMSYDAELKSFASEMSFIDHSNSNALYGFKRTVVSQLWDGQSSLKFHLMERNFGYRHLSSDETYEQRGDGQPNSNWRPCATNHLSARESRLLLDERSDLLNLEGAIYMGMALVRGIRCQVFERRLLGLPIWFGLDMRTSGKDKYILNIFLYFDRQGEPILTRLQLKEIRQEAETLSWVLDLNSFRWSSEDFTDDGSLSHQTLIERMTQHCLLLEPGARHLDVEFWFKRAASGQELAMASDQRDEIRLVRELKSSAKLRDRSLIEMLAKSLKISPVQQVEFASEVLSAEGESPAPNWLLYVKFSLYELWNDLVEEELIGFALDRGFNARLNLMDGSLYAQGARSYSFEDCKWRAIHSLKRPSVTSEYSRRDADSDAESPDNNVRLFMYCPDRLICHLGDSSWLPLRQRRPLTLKDVLEFPYRAGPNASPMWDLNKCLVSSVIIRQQSMLSKSSGLQSCRSKLEWWLVSGRHGSSGGQEQLNGGTGETDDDEDALIKLQLRNVKYQLKVGRKRAASGGSPAGDGNHRAADQATVGRSLLMEASKLRLSNRVLISNANNDNIDEQPATTSLLTKPLAGLAYRARFPVGSAATSGSGSGSGASRNTSHTGELTTANNSIEPVIVLNVAECSRLCLLLHECRSFSACHQSFNTWPRDGDTGASEGRISCLFSKISWSNPIQANQLKRLARRAGSTGSEKTRSGASVSLEVDVNELGAGRRALVELELSHLCSLHARPQMNLFRMRRSHSEVQPKLANLIYSRSVEQCARFCQERAELIRVLEKNPADPDREAAVSSGRPGMSGASRWAACHEFYYSADNHYCKLIPVVDHWQLLKLKHLLVAGSERPGRQQQRAAPANETDRGHASGEEPLIGRWRDWFQRSTPLERWAKRIASLFGESEYYELDFRQIFIAHQNHRLTLIGSANDATAPGDPDEGQLPLQVQLSIESRVRCAEFCLRRKGCQSFSFKSAGRQRPATCLLNAIAARDLPELSADERNSSASAAAAAAASFKFERVAAASNETREVWWHYEPSELASFVMLDPDEWRRPPRAMAAGGPHSGDGDSGDDADLFVRPEPSLFYD